MLKLAAKRSWVAAGLLLWSGQAGAGAATLGVRGGEFTLDGKPAFLLGISYYGGLGARAETWKSDLDAMRKHRFNWLRVWATWAAFDHDVSAVDGEGRARPEYLEKLKRLVAECDRRGMVADVTLSRGNGVTGPPRLQTLAAHRRAVETVVTALKPWRNWYLDLSNERNVEDKRFTPISEVGELRDLVKKIDPDRLVTASHSGDITREELKAYVAAARLDFITPHRRREAESAGQTEERTRELLAWMREMGRTVPVHYQEPFRRGYAGWEPAAKDFLADLKGARDGGAAGWCLHNGSTRTTEDQRPRRSFDLRDGPLFRQLDAQERAVAEAVRKRNGP